MTDENKNSNLIIFGLGIVAMFFAYLIYVKSKEPTTQPSSSPVLSLHPDLYNNPYNPYNNQPYNIQPTLQCPPPQIIQFPQQYQNQQSQVELYKISEQLKLQNSQIQAIQEQQAQQLQNINQIENTKCSNVVSMDNTYQPLSLNNMKSLRTPKYPTNVRRENEEQIAKNIFGMQ